MRKSVLGARDEILPDIPKAERTGFIRSVLPKFENVRVIPSLGAFANIAEALGVTMSEPIDGAAPA